MDTIDLLIIAKQYTKIYLQHAHVCAVCLITTTHGHATIIEGGV
jgi:hypothetical protein